MKLINKALLKDSFEFIDYFRWNIETIAVDMSLFFPELSDQMINRWLILM